MPRLPDPNLFAEIRRRLGAECPPYIGAAVLAIRLDMGLSQRRFSKKVGVSRTSVSNWETGRCLPSAGELRSLLEGLEMSEAEVMENLERKLRERE